MTNSSFAGRVREDPEALVAGGDEIQRCFEARVRGERGTFHGPVASYRKTFSTTSPAGSFRETVLGTSPRVRVSLIS